MRTILSLLRNLKGQSFVELTLLLPFLLALVGGASDLGLAFFADHIAQNAAREGARRAATLQTNPCTGTPNGKTTADTKVRTPSLVNSVTATYETRTLITN